MHRMHTITKLNITPNQLSSLLVYEEELGRRIHDPKSIYNPTEDKVNYHWRFRGHDRQIRKDLAIMICDFLSVNSECANGARI